MSIYCMGDIQGCAGAFAQLMQAIDFSPSRDTLYILGDLVNRGHDSASVLRRCRALEGSVLPVLGNHDLHLLAVACGARSQSRRDTLDGVLHAEDRDDLLHWLRQQPLARLVQHGGAQLLAVHAGVLPQWTAAATVRHAQQVHEALRGAESDAFLRQMYGNVPAAWDDALEGIDRLRVIVNALTRLRFCTPAGRMDFDSAESAEQAPAGLIPWFEAPQRQSADTLIAFGHWSTLGLVNRPGLLGLDTGCVWGGALSVARLGASWDEREILQLPCPQAQQPG